MKIPKLIMILILGVMIANNLPIITVKAESTDSVSSEVSSINQETTTEVKTTPKNETLQSGAKTYNDYFPDDNFAKAVAEGFRDTVHTVITVEQLANLSSVYNLQNYTMQGIKDTTGIEYLTGLTDLRISNNPLNSLDISKNTALVRLECSNNQLTSLDVSKNTALTALYCKDNQLTTLDLSENTALTSLDCSNNELTNLDVSKNTALTGLYCRNNQLTNLDVSKNTALASLHCRDNQLTNLDLSQNTALEYLECQYNQLTNLDLSQNTELMYLHCDNNQLTDLDLKSNTSLIYLYCFNNQLTHLNVSQNPYLRTLSCSNNQLTDIDVSQNPALVDFICVNNQLTNLDVSQNPALTFMECSNNQIKDISTLADNFITSDYFAINQALVTPTQVTQNNSLSYKVPSDILDINGDVVQTIVPQNGGVYDPTTQMITWDNLAATGNVSYTFESDDTKFSGTVTIPYAEAAIVAISILSDDEISYSKGTTKTEAAFLTDIHAQATPVGNNIESDFANVVDLQTPGKYTVTLQITGTDITKEVTVYVTETPQTDDPVIPAPPKDTDKKANYPKTEDPVTPAPLKDADKKASNPKTKEASPKNYSIKEHTKALPKTGDTILLGWVSFGVICLGMGILVLTKRRKKTIK